MLRPTLRSLLLLASLPTTLPLLAGCPDAGPEVIPPTPAPGPVSFARLAPAQREAAIRAALGLTPQRAIDVLYFAQDDHEKNASCPARAQDGDKVSYAAPGCQAPSGLHYAGNATVVNSPIAGDFRFLDDPRDRQPSQIVFSDFAVTDAAGATEIFDGRIDQSQAEPVGAYQLTTDLHLDGGALDLELDYTCDADGCSGSGEGALAGAGSFTIVADLRGANGEPLQAGSLELHGEDLLTVDLGDRFARTSCYAYRVNGALAGKLCPDATPAPPQKPRTRRLTPALIDQVLNARFSCTAPKPRQPVARFDLQLQDHYDANRDDVAPVDETSVTATMKRGERQRVTPVAPTGHEFSGGPELVITYFYETLLSPDTAETPFSCSEVESIGVRFDGRLTDGQTFCIIRGNADEFPDATECAREPL
jgi:hypothetical protein